MGGRFLQKLVVVSSIAAVMSLAAVTASAQGETTDPPADETADAPATEDTTAPEETAPARTGTYQEGFTTGQIAGGMSQQPLWYLLGFGGGCLLSAIGCLVVTGIAAIVPPTAPMAPDAAIRTPAYQRGYMEGYQKKARGRAAWQAFLGGTLSTALVITIYFTLVTIQIPNVGISSLSLGRTPLLGQPNPGLQGAALFRF